MSDRPRRKRRAVLLALKLALTTMLVLTGDFLVFWDLFGFWDILLAIVKTHEMDHHRVKTFKLELLSKSFCSEICSRNGG